MPFFIAVDAIDLGVLSVGLASNIGYLGAKIRCVIFDCCANRRNDSWSIPLRVSGISLQHLECIMTLAVIWVGASVAFMGGIKLASLLLFSGHALVRCYAGILRFPLRSPLYFARDSGVTGVAAIGILTVLY